MNLFVVDADGTNFTTLTDDKRINAGERWTPDSQRIVFDSLVGINAVRADGTAALVVYPINRDSGVNAALSHDLSKAIVRTEVDRIHGLYDTDIEDLRTGSKTRLTTSADGVHGFVWSQDGAQVAYAQEDVPDTWSIRVVDADGTNAQTLLTVSEQSAGLPRLSLVGINDWTGDGDYLVYSRTYTVARFESETQICYVSTDGSDESCLPTKYPGMGTIGSSSLLLN